MPVGKDKNLSFTDYSKLTMVLRLEVSKFFQRSR